MEKENSSAQDLFKLIKESVFRTVEVEKVAWMSEAEQQQFLLEQVNRLLLEAEKAKSPKENAALWLGNQFWTIIDEERCKKQDYNPFFDTDEREKMNDDEKMLCAFYITMSGLCYDLCHHLPFDALVLGIDATDEFFVDNEPLVKWIKSTPYIYIATHIALTMKKQAKMLMVSSGYKMAEDYLASLKAKSAKELIATIIDALQAIDSHLAEGTEKGLTLDQVFMHDEIYGSFAREFDESIVSAIKK